MTCVIGYSNQTDFSTLSGGSFNSNYPITNLQNRYLAQKARTNNALLSSSVIQVDLGSVQRIGLISLINHNFTMTSTFQATVRLQAFSDAGMTLSLFDTGFESIYSGSDYARTFPQVEGRYWRISINDPNNQSGYVEFGRLFIGWRFSPTNNISWSPTLTVESKTPVIEALGGPEYFDERPNRRLWQGKFSWLDNYEAYRAWFLVMKSHDVSREVYLIDDDTDTAYRDIRWFLGRLRVLNPIEYPYLNQYGAAIEIGELL